jgi:hypothetical protein
LRSASHEISDAMQARVKTISPQKSHPISASHHGDVQVGPEASGSEVLGEYSQEAPPISHSHIKSKKYKVKGKRRICILVFGKI